MVDLRELQTGKHIAKIDVGVTSITWIVGLQSGVSPLTPRNAKPFASGGLGLESIKIFKQGWGIESSTQMSRFHIWGLVRPTFVLGCPTEREHFEGQGKIVGPEESNGGSLWEVASNNDPLDKTNCVTDDILWCRMLLLNSEIAGGLEQTRSGTRSRGSNCPRIGQIFFHRCGVSACKHQTGRTPDLEKTIQFYGV